MSKPNSTEDNHLRVTITKGVSYKIFIESIKEGKYLSNIINDDINNNGEHQFRIILGIGTGNQTHTEYILHGGTSKDFIFKYFFHPELDGIGTEPDGQLKIHFEEADEVPV